VPKKRGIAAYLRGGGRFPRILNLFWMQVSGKFHKSVATCIMNSARVVLSPQICNLEGKNSESANTRRFPMI
jgi:hypothetical protein